MAYTSEEAGRTDAETSEAPNQSPTEEVDMAPAKRTTPPALSPSFTFDAVEWLTNSALCGLSHYQKGRLFTRICRAVVAGDRAAIEQLQGTMIGRAIGRVYWREQVDRPSIPPSIRRAVFDRDGEQCVWCGSLFPLELDHIVPVCRGGEGTIANLQVLCKPCNRRKGASV